LNKNHLILPALVLCAATLAQAQGAAPTKIGIIHVQAAILGTKDGKKAGDELNAKFGQRKSELDKKQAAIDQLKDQLQKGSATMSDDAKNKLVRQIDSETTALRRPTWSRKKARFSTNLAPNSMPSWRNTRRTTVTR